MKLIVSHLPHLLILLTVFATAPVMAVAQSEKPATAPAAPLRNDPLHVFSQSVQALTEIVTKSVVQIVATGYGFANNANDKESNSTALFEPQEAIGSGVILTSDGYIVTNAHVVQGARRIRVRLPGLETPGADGSPPRGPVNAKVVGLDRQSDLAVLKIDATGLPALPLADGSSLSNAGTTASVIMFSSVWSANEAAYRFVNGPQLSSPQLLGSFFVCPYPAKAPAITYA